MAQYQGNPYLYQNLVDPKDFRLLRLHPGKGERIDCKIEHSNLRPGEFPAYRAISYTWGNDDTGFNIHLPGDAIIRVRKNVRDALLSIRDDASDCLLWIDAICINQNSTGERSQQVRLMAEIYNNANVVLVWLKSAGETADVARAFKFVHAAVTHNEGSEHSVYDYAMKNRDERGQNWRAVVKLCRLRYWTRKWIIQELVMARTVVLQVGDSELAMKDLQKFCSQLHRNRENEGYQKLNVRRHKLWRFVVTSPAARLALERSKTTRSARPARILHDLIERYADNECHDPSDHVYALYSLVGNHRTNLSVDYGASKVQRLVDVMSFAHYHEHLRPPKVLEFAHLLARLLNIGPGELLGDPHQRMFAEGLDLVVPATVLGTIESQDESKRSGALRKQVEPLPPIFNYVFDTSQEPWAFKTRQGVPDPLATVGRPDMTYFRIAGTQYYGLAACLLRSGDAIWRFPRTQLAFAIRRMPESQAHILGRAYIFSETLQLDKIRHGEQQLSMNLATLFELSLLGAPTQRSSGRNVELDLKLSRFGWMIDAKETEWKCWEYRVVMGASVVIFALMLAVILVRRQ